MAEIRILSIDGGGIRGIIPATVLEHIEEKTGRRASELFHLVAGTSTGGILGCGLVKPDGAMTAAELKRLYEKRGPEIFRMSPWKTLTSLSGATDERYSVRNLEGILNEVLGEVQLADVKGVELLVTSYAIELPDKVANTQSYQATRAPFFFKNWKARGQKLDPGESAADFDFKLRDVARATSAAPTYFEPALIKSRSEAAYSMIDGGVFANNPALCALASAYKLWGRKHSYVVVSLGTGQLQRPMSHANAKDWGVFEWLRPLMSVLFDASSDTVHYQLDELLGSSHFRFDIPLGADPNDEKAVNDDFDDASPPNIRALIDKGSALVKKEEQKLASLIDRLSSPKESLT
ncbi:patatin-like phospholipase family protein [Pyxidicoccus caerfyrddinensis]|uniref:patatin-like phospholipase family protein n=1 Tax=Pyxidicoccus caerfyrddinensis TaxID=2709663 RepID=UPI0013D8EA3F|nr:patatin-like phospholipase family protein [Pyxidicoccus caerfyrddinensis]